jgi:transposase
MPPAGLMIYVATQPVDFRKGADGLALLAKEMLGHDPMKGVRWSSVRSAPTG